MKIKKIILIVFPFILFSCNDINTGTKEANCKINGVPLYIYIIDSCEYIGKIKGVPSDIITHKGNCKNH